jgi:hypothetical protein
MIKNVYLFSSKAPVIRVRLQLYLNLPDIFSKSTQIWNFMKIRRVGAELFHADRLTDMTTKIAGFRNERLSSGYFSGVWVLKADVSEHCVGSIFNRWWNVNDGEDNLSLQQHGESLKTRFSKLCERA